MEFSGKLISPSIPKVQTVEIALYEDTEICNVVDTQDIKQHSICGGIVLSRGSEMLKIWAFVPSSLFHRIALSLDSYKLDLFSARGRRLEYRKSVLFDFDLKPMIKNPPDMNQQFKNKKTSPHIKNSIKKIEQSIDELEKARAVLISMLPR